MRLTVLTITALTLLGSLAHATSDANSRVAVVVKNIQAEGSETDAFFIERAPIIGCYGPARGAELAQWTAEYKVPSNIGCGGQKFEDNINELVCAKVVKAEESDDYMSYKAITLDISKCEAKTNPNFITMVRTSAKINFPQSDKKKEVKLTLIK